MNKEYFMNGIRYTIVLPVLSLLVSCTQSFSYEEKVVEVLKNDVLSTAQENLQKPAVTVTESYCERSAGGRHYFYSEGDYWWPDTLNPDGPYIRRDGLTNPENFTAHRKAMIRFSQIVGNLTSAYVITKDAKYAEAALTHIQAWFVNDSTKMNPNLLYAQAIKGRHTGRGIGIIDAIHFIEVVKSIMILDADDLVDKKTLSKSKQWFSDFTLWLTTHEYGLKEKVHPNNHGTCWNMQVAIFSKFTQNDSVFNACKESFINDILPSQMAEDGSFPLELDRTKPYGYSLFNLDAMVMNCMILSDDSDDLWYFTTEDGRGIEKAIAYMAPFVKDKSTWPLEPDVMCWENWPVAHPAFLFGATKLNKPDWYYLWENNEHNLKVQEVIRNMPIRNPILWLGL